ncbi:MAG: LTA synthase family protein [Cytophagaceae bacterium]|nr:LTA synthase family protein [Cytophagaceae bacterium]
MKYTLYSFLFILIALCNSCQVKKPVDTTEAKVYKTENIMVLVVDGPRYSETWGDSTHRYIPHMANDLAKSGIICSNFYNDGFTYTSSGHAALCTGYKQQLENTKGSQLPDYPSYFQYYLKKTNKPASDAWIITSKDKLAMLANCNDAEWKDKYNPSINCGNNGQGSGYRNDLKTFQEIKNVLSADHPHMLLVNFKEPDGAGHANDWNKYLKGIVETDSLVWEIWKYIQTDIYYKDKTTLFVTNDHGRHLDGWKDGFVSHGDDCEGCRHINLFAYGPDFKSGIILDKTYAQVDLTATIAELAGLKMPYGQGKVIKELFK